jgi:co-chaperonin GroES (HSP10)
MSEVTSNLSGIHPQGHRVLIRTLELEAKTVSGIILATAEQAEREEMSNTTGDVIAVGPDANGWGQVGDRVIFAKYAGLLYVGKDGKKYRVINDDNIVATLGGDITLVDPHLVKR